MGDLRLQRETIERSRDNMGKARNGSPDGWARWVTLAWGPRICWTRVLLQEDEGAIEYDF